MLVAALIDTGPQGKWAEEIVANGGLNAPALIYAEVSNVLRRLETARQILPAEANLAFDDLVQLPLEIYSFEPFADRIWELRYNVTCYDAWYIALAEALSLPLATLDSRIVRNEIVACKLLTTRN